MNYCKCDQYRRRGGDDCSRIYCLNECTGHGVCNEVGVCECDEDYYGVDCSVHVMSAISGGQEILVRLSLLVGMVSALVLL